MPMPTTLGSKAVSARSDAHQCEVCGVYAPHGFKQTDGDYYWFCFAHRLEGYKLPDLAPTPKLPGQTELFNAPKIDREAEFARSEGRPWPVRFISWLRYLVVEGEAGTAETFNARAERRIGKAPDAHLYGSVMLRAAADGLFERAGHGRMRGPKAHGRETPLWKRTSRI